MVLLYSPVAVGGCVYCTVVRHYSIKQMAGTCARKNGLQYTTVQYWYSIVRRQRMLIEFGGMNGALLRHTAVQ